MQTAGSWLACFALATTLVATQARANDSASELAVGGLVLVKTDRVTMQREDLTITPSEIQVRYEMRNPSPDPVTLRVAFPLPVLPKDTPGGMETGSGSNINLRPPTDPNFIDFHLSANGKPVAFETEIRATLPNGTDITQALRDIGGPTLPLQPRMFPRDTTAGAANDGWDLDAKTRTALQKIGAITLDDDAYDTLWSTTITFHWMQTFPPGVTIIEHRYHPILGIRLYGAISRTKQSKGDPQTGVWEASGGGNIVQAFCIDPGTDRAMRTFYANLLRRREAADPAANDAYFVAYTLGYILKTANNWQGPIGTFHLTLQGGHIAEPNATPAEARMFSLCTDLPLRQTAPMRFEATARDYVPKQDIRLLILAE